MEDKNLEEPQVRVKHEPPVEFVLILPRPTVGWPAIKQEDVKSKRWVKSVQLTKFDANWRGELKPFQTYFTCQHCQLVLKTRGFSTRHLKACRKINPARFECDICGERFRQKSRMRRHMWKHSNEKRFRCPKCGSGFKGKDGLNHHLRSKMINKCAVCDLKFSCHLLLFRHRNEFHGNVFKCDKCSYETKFEFNLMSHRGTHDKSFACETCHKKVSTAPELKLHQMQHRHGIYAMAPEETFDCDECDKSFSRSDCLRNHQRLVHDENEVKCEVCDKICKNRSALLNHSLIHVKVECLICQKIISKNFASLHMRIMHSVESIFECDLCEYSTKTRKNLKYHIERNHLLRKLVDDSKGREDFSDFELLEKLQLIHGSSATSCEKKFKCDKCSKAFVIPKLLNRHKKQVHAGKFVECQICKKKLSQHNFKSHMKFHSPGNHFECDLCDYKCERKNSLESHIKRRHRNGALICHIGCKGKFANFHQLIEHRKIHVGKKLWKCAKCEYETVKCADLSKHMSAQKHKMSS